MATIMNIHVSKEIVDKWPSHEFRGQRRRSLKYGFEYMEAYHKTLGQTFYYIFEADSFVDYLGVQCGAPELIFNTRKASEIK